MSDRRKRWNKFGVGDEDTNSSSDDDCNDVPNNKLTTGGDKELVKTLDQLKRYKVEKLKNLPNNFNSLEEKVIGPSHLQEPREITEESKNEFGPALPSYLLESHNAVQGSKSNDSLCEIGPAIPPYLLKSRDKEQDTGSIDSPEVIGPALPPHLVKSRDKDQGSIDSPEVIGPALPPHFVIEEDSQGIVGPALPTHLKKSSDIDEGSNASDSQNAFGPALPSFLLSSRENDAVGPSLPSDTDDNNRSERILGPQLPPGFSAPNSDSDDDDFVGPDPRLQGTSSHSTQSDVDSRAERSRRKMLGLDEQKVERESWMLELPPERAAIMGLNARQFRAKLAPEMGDRSVWTDTPTEKAKKEKQPIQQDGRDLIRKQLIEERDKEMERMARKAEKKLKREESLLESHMKKMKKHAKKEAEKNKDAPKERKRFNREEDMQVNRFDEAQKKAIFKKAQMLNDRFSQGESKFL